MHGYVYLQCFWPWCEATHDQKAQAAAGHRQTRTILRVGYTYTYSHLAMEDLPGDLGTLRTAHVTRMQPLRLLLRGSLAGD